MLSVILLEKKIDVSLIFLNLKTNNHNFLYYKLYLYFSVSHGYISLPFTGREIATFLCS